MTVIMNPTHGVLASVVPEGVLFIKYVFFWRHNLSFTYMLLEWLGSSSILENKICSNVLELILVLGGAFWSS